jgi:phenylalanyl-tRNA synthetase alpha chain
MEKDNKKIIEIIEKLSPIELKVVPYLNNEFKKIGEKSGLDEVSLLRALRFLENKGLVRIKCDEKAVIELNTNGIYYKKHNLPERRLLLLLETNNHLTLEEALKLSKLTENEFKVSLGVLKGKALVMLNNGKLSLNAKKEELVKKLFEEQLLEVLPVELDKLSPELKFALENLKKRKEIVKIQNKKVYSLELTAEGKEIAGKEIKSEFIEEVTPDIIKSENKSLKFRKYDIKTPLPRIYGGKRHFVNQSIDYARKIWTDLGFKEMTGNLAQTGFWNFDALFTAQDHPVRELQDTFYIKNVKGKITDKKVAEAVKTSHETGVEGSKGWRYKWSEEEARKVILRTHTTCLSAQTLASLRDLKNKTGKFFAIGKCFRNETLDWSHGFEFNQTEGIVIDGNVNFKNLLGYLQEFYKKMGYDKVKFVPSYFPYTEPSVEIYIWHKEKSKWLELGGAGIFRPEVVVPLLGEYIPVLAWGPGFDRTIMEYYDIKDLREMYENDIKKLRDKKGWTK